jgi:hypothetical protein
MNQQQVNEAIAYNQKEVADGDLTDSHVIRMVEFWQQNHDLEGDGKAGGMTQKSLDDSIEREWETCPPPPCTGEDQFVDGKWLPWDGPEESQPKSREQVEYFGNPETQPGSNQMSKTWYRKHIIECHQSNGNRLPGIPAKWYIKVHKMVEPYLREALRRCEITSDYAINRMGSYNFRHMGNDPGRSLSMHSFGAAFDVNPPDNSGMHYSRGNSPSAYSDRYMKRWPKGVPAEFVQAFNSCGFAWGSDWNEDGRTEDHTFLDPMHFEWVARDGIKFEV